MNTSFTRSHVNQFSNKHLYTIIYVYKAKTISELTKLLNCIYKDFFLRTEFGSSMDKSGGKNTYVLVVIGPFMINAVSTHRWKEKNFLFLKLQLKNGSIH